MNKAAIVLVFFFESWFGNKMLFVIERSKDSNQVLYKINLKNGGLNTEEPIEVCWLKREERNQKEPLSWIQKKYAYGVNILSSDSEMAVFQFVSYKKQDFIVKKDGAGFFRVFTEMNHKKIQVKKIFVQITGGSFWSPKIPRIDLMGIELNTNKAIIETLEL